MKARTTTTSGAIVRTTKDKTKMKAPSLSSNHALGRAMCWLCAVCAAATFPARAGSPPAVTNVVAGQKAGTMLVNIQYTISDAVASNVNVYMLVSADSGASWTVPASSFTGDYGPNIIVSAAPVVK